MNSREMAFEIWYNASIDRLKKLPEKEKLRKAFLVAIGSQEGELKAISFQLQELKEMMDDKETIYPLLTSLARRSATAAEGHYQEIKNVKEFVGKRMSELRFLIRHAPKNKKPPSARSVRQ